MESAPTPICSRTRRAILAMLALALFSGTVAAASISGNVSQVHEGDLVLLTDRGGSHYRIRLAGIEAPSPDTAPGKAARNHLAMLVAGKPVTVEIISRARGRIIVGKLMLGSADINLRQLQQGVARYHPVTGMITGDQTDYQAAETKARQQGLGLWRQASPDARPALRQQ